MIKRLLLSLILFVFGIGMLWLGQTLMPKFGSGFQPALAIVSGGLIGIGFVLTMGVLVVGLIVTIDYFLS